MSDSYKEKKYHEIPRKNWEDRDQYNVVLQRRSTKISERRKRRFSKLWSRLVAKIGRRSSKKKIEESLHDNYESIIPPPPLSSNDYGI